MFVSLIDDRYGTEVIININKISFIMGSKIVMDGIHGEGNGMILLSKESLEKVLSVLDVKKI